MWLFAGRAYLYTIGKKSDVGPINSYLARLARRYGSSHSELKWTAPLGPVSRLPRIAENATRSKHMGLLTCAHPC